MPVASREVVTNNPHWPSSDLSDGEHQARKRSTVMTLCKHMVLLSLLDYWAWTDFSAGYSEPSSAGCKQFSVGFPALDDSGSTATAEVSVNGMDPPDLGFSPAEATTETSGQSASCTLTSQDGRSWRSQFYLFIGLLDVFWCRTNEDKGDILFSANFLSQRDVLKVTVGASPLQTVWHVSAGAPGPLSDAELSLSGRSLRSMSKCLMFKVPFTCLKCK